MEFIASYFLSGKSARSHHLLLTSTQTSKNNRPHFETGSLRSGEILMLAPHLKNVETYVIYVVLLFPPSETTT